MIDPATAIEIVSGSQNDFGEGLIRSKTLDRSTYVFCFGFLYLLLGSW